MSTLRERRRSVRKAVDAMSHEHAILRHPLAQEHDDRASVEVVESYFSADGRPIKRKSLGAARIARRYDHDGNKVEEAYFNAEGKPTALKGVGAARIEWRYDAQGKRIEASFFGADGALIDRKATQPEAERLESA